jgi:hypothetical protein
MKRSATFTRPSITGTSTSGPITVAIQMLRSIRQRASNIHA